MLTLQFWELVLTKVHLNLKSEAAKSYLNYLWWILEPALFVAVFYVVFGLFLNRQSDDFIVFLMCGKIPFLWFSRSVNNSANAIVSGRGLMNQIAIDKVFFPLVVVLQDFVKSSVVISFMLIGVWSAGFDPDINWFWLPVVVFVQLLLITAVSLVCAAAVPFVPDLRFIIQTGTMMMMFASGIFYSYKDVLLPEHQDLFLLNPVANLIRMYREMLMEGIAPRYIDLLAISVGSFLVIVAMSALYKRLGPHYPRLALQ